MNNNYKIYHYLILNFYINKLFYFLLFILLLSLDKFYFSKRRKSDKAKKKLFYNNNLKICLCTLGKKENHYIKEYIEHYINYGVDKIFLYDNNDLDGERFEDVIAQYIKQGNVEIINYRGIPKAIFKIMKTCYNNNYNEYDWLIFYEIDEFIYLKHFKNIKNYLNQKKFEKCKSIYLNWVHRSDNNLLYYDNRTLISRFKEKGMNVKKKKNYLALVKTIIRGHIGKINKIDIHRLTKKINGCDGFGKKAQIIGNRNAHPDYKYYYINHYYSKSTEEFVEKLKRGDMQFGNSTKNYLYQIKKYFYINKITLEKIIFLENSLGVNLSKYKNQIINISIFN